MNDEDEKLIEFIQMWPLLYLAHAIKDYSERLKHSHSVKEQVRLKNDLYGLKEAIKIYWN